LRTSRRGLTDAHRLCAGNHRLRFAPSARACTSRRAGLLAIDPPKGDEAMKFALGFAFGVAAVWAALAIWQRIPPLGPIDPGDDYPPPPWTDPEAFYAPRPNVDAVFRRAHGGFGSP